MKCINITKKDIINSINKKTGFLKSDISEVIEALFDTLEEGVSNKKNIKLNWLYLGCKEVNEKKYLNPKTNEWYIKKKYYLPYIKLGNSFKNRSKVKMNG